MTAPQAAGVIHSDFQKGFIRAETVSCVQTDGNLMTDFSLQCYDISLQMPILQLYGILIYRCLFFFLFDIY